MTQNAYISGFWNPAIIFRSVSVRPYKVSDIYYIIDSLILQDYLQYFFSGFIDLFRRISFCSGFTIFIYFAVFWNLLICTDKIRNVSIRVCNVLCKPINMCCAQK